MIQSRVEVSRNACPWPSLDDSLLHVQKIQEQMQGGFTLTGSVRDFYSFAIFGYIADDGPRL